MKAAIAPRIPCEELELADLPEPIPQPGELVLRVDACGICGTDLHIMEGSSYRPHTPFVLGHEPVGTVSAIGSEVDSQWLGRRVVPTLFTGCGVCALCMSGDERLCLRLRSILGVDRAQGGFAQRLVMRVEQAVEVPANLESEVAAILVDAGATAANSVRQVEFAPPGPVVVVGGGPVGLIVAELIRLAGRDLVVVQTSPVRRQALVEMGHPVVAHLDAVKLEPAAVIECAGSPASLPWAIDRLTGKGVYVAAGYSMANLVDLATISHKELTIVGVRSGRRADLVTALSLAAAGSIRLPAVSVWPLDRINAAIGALRTHMVPGKAVIQTS